MDIHTIAPSLLTDITHSSGVATLALTLVTHSLKRATLAILAHVCLTGVSFLMARTARHHLVLSGHTGEVSQTTIDVNLTETP